MTVSTLKTHSANLSNNRESGAAGECVHGGDWQAVNEIDPRARVGRVSRHANMS